jgi:hypothetical protein
MRKIAVAALWAAGVMFSGAAKASTSMVDITLPLTLNKLNVAEGFVSIPDVPLNYGNDVIFNVTFSEPLIAPNPNIGWGIYTYHFTSTGLDGGDGGVNILAHTGGLDFLQYQNFQPASEIHGFSVDVNIGGPVGGVSTTVTGLRFLFAIPEPSTWAFMILGFGASGVMLRRQRLLEA